MFHAWVGGQTKFRVEAMSGLSFAAMNASIDASVQARVKQLVDGDSLMGQRIDLRNLGAERRIEEVSERQPLPFGKRHPTG